MRSRKILNKLAALLALAVVLLPATALAAASVVAPGITVSPARLDFTLKKSQPAQTIPVTITNSYGVPVELIAQFKGIDESTGLFVPTNNIEEGMARALHISETDINLPAHSRRKVLVQLSDNRALSPGGHYATLVLNQNGARSSLQAALSLNIFAVKTAGAVTALKLTKFSSNGWLFRLPTTASLNFLNTGNVYEVPRAAVSVLGRHGNIISQGVANEGSLPILPTDKLYMSVSLQKLAHVWLPQRLSLHIAYRGDGSNTAQTVERSQLYVPPAYLLVLLVAIIAAGWLLTRRRPVKSVAVGSPQLVAPTTATKPRPIQVVVNATKRIIAVIEQSETVAVPVKSVRKPAPKSKPRPKKPPAKPPRTSR